MKNFVVTEYFRPGVGFIVDKDEDASKLKCDNDEVKNEFQPIERGIEDGEEEQTGSRYENLL